MRRPGFCFGWRSACDPLLPLTVRLQGKAVRGKGAFGQAAALRVPPERAFAEALVMHAAWNTSLAAQRAAPGGGDFCGGEERRPSVGARSALRELTRRSYLSAESEANAASSATRLKDEHRSGVGASLRPPQHEPPAGTACGAAQKTPKVGHIRVAATGRERPPGGFPPGCACNASGGALESAP